MKNSICVILFFGLISAICYANCVNSEKAFIGSDLIVKCETDLYNGNCFANTADYGHPNAPIDYLPNNISEGQYFNISNSGDVLFKIPIKTDLYAVGGNYTYTVKCFNETNSDNFSSGFNVVVGNSNDMVANYLLTIKENSLLFVGAIILILFALAIIIYCVVLMFKR